jgi:hypothetical protein
MVAQGNCPTLGFLTNVLTFIYSNCHVHSESLAGMKLNNYFRSTSDVRCEPPSQTRRVAKIIRFMSQETHDYLMQTFFQKYNTVMHTVHEKSFWESRDQDSNQYYSGFLHICILAMGYRCADKSREDVKRLAGPEQIQDSTLHKEAKFMLDTELERPGGMI